MSHEQLSDKLEVSSSLCLRVTSGSAVSAACPLLRLLTLHGIIMHPLSHDSDNKVPLSYIKQPQTWLYRVCCPLYP